MAQSNSIPLMNPPRRSRCLACFYIYIFFSFHSLPFIYFFYLTRRMKTTVMLLVWVDEVVTTGMVVPASSGHRPPVQFVPSPPPAGLFSPKPAPSPPVGATTQAEQGKTEQRNEKQSRVEKSREGQCLARARQDGLMHAYWRRHYLTKAGNKKAKGKQTQREGV